MQIFFGSAMVDYTSEKLKNVAFSVIIAVAVLAALGSVIISSVASEGFEISEVTLKKGTSTSAVFMVEIKNLGNSQIDKINVTIDGLDLSGTVAVVSSTTSKAIIGVDGDATVRSATGPFDSITYVLQNSLLDVGEIASIAVNIPHSDSLLTGSSYTITVEAETDPGNTKTYETAVVRVSRI